MQLLFLLQPLHLFLSSSFNAGRANHSLKPWQVMLSSYNLLSSSTNLILISGMVIASPMSLVMEKASCPDKLLTLLVMTLSGIPWLLIKHCPDTVPAMLCQASSAVSCSSYEFFTRWVRNSSMEPRASRCWRCCQSPRKILTCRPWDHSAGISQLNLNSVFKVLKQTYD